MNKYFYKITLFCLAIVSIANSKISNLPEINPDQKLAFPELTHQAMNNSKIIDLNLNEQQLNMLLQAYEYVLCSKLHKDFKHLKTFSYFMPSINVEKIENYYATCKKHEHLNAETLKEFNARETSQLPKILAQRYHERFGLSLPITSNFHKIVIESFKKEIQKQH